MLPLRVAVRLWMMKTNMSYWLVSIVLLYEQLYHKEIIENTSYWDRHFVFDRWNGTEYHNEFNG